jgi:chromosomal replication initiation ATPase DnaA
LDEVVSSTLLGSAYLIAFIKEIGLHFGIGGSGVSQACRRVAQKIEKDRGLKKKIVRLEK